MAVDLKQFHQVFIEESFEGLESMEQALMALDINHIDSETINAIFRAAHSIKGGSATFGFSAIAGFTHVLETLLDQVRAGQRGLSSDDVNLFLQSVDAMREMLGLLQNEQNAYTDLALSLKAQFEALLHGDSRTKTPTKNTPAQKAATKAPAAESNTASSQGWQIDFVPETDIFASGNCPLRLLQEVQKLGEYRVHSYVDLPSSFQAFNPERCYIRWQLVVHTSASLNDIKDIFAWVEDMARIDIAPLPNATDTAIVPMAGWRLSFKPKLRLLHSGNDPIRIFRSLTELGTLHNTQCFTEAVPSLKLLDPENLYLHWQIDMQTEASAEKVNALFDWVNEEADIRLESLHTLDQPPRPEALASAENRPQAQSAVTVASVPVSSSAAPVEKKTVEHKSASDNNKKAPAAESASIRVGIDKIDSLINMVGELVITQSMLGQLSNDLDLAKVPKLMEGLSQLAQNTRELQESVMRIRMLPISFAFSRFPRMVRDLGQQLGKKIQLELSGENTELDKTVMEKIGDPLVHLVRNAVDHGIEPPDVRQAKGKNPEGLIVLNAYHQSGNVVIEIIDDGKGLDREAILAKAIEKSIITPAEAQQLSDEQIYDLIFQPGFSTAKTVSDVSGRGVGMDVVKRNIQALNGVVEIQSKMGHGSKIRIRLPLTLAILDGQLVRVHQHTYIFPLVSIVESVQYRPEFIRHIAGGCSVFKLREDYVPVVHLRDIFSVHSNASCDDQPLMVVVESEGEKVGVVVDELMAQQQVVIKSLEQNYRKVEGVSGATILGDGTVALILDIQGIVRLAGFKQQKELHSHDGAHTQSSYQSLSHLRH
jgi:two-component system, chemotaxis family, sensor kinase CheA